MQLLELLKRGASRLEKPRSLWTAAEWARVRAPKRHRDAELSPKARRWFNRLPPDVQPHAACAQFPRIVNQLAACWSDVGLIEHLLESLVIDRRGGRHGFPSDVADELALLYEYHALRVELISTQEDAAARPTGTPRARLT